MIDSKAMTIWRGQCDHCGAQITIRQEAAPVDRIERQCPWCWSGHLQLHLDTGGATTPTIPTKPAGSPMAEPVPARPFFEDLA